MPPPEYLEPYLQAAAQFGAGFGSLLWASPKSQAVRFDAFARHCGLDGRIVLDAGCGRGDLLDHLLARRISPGKYIGLEAVAAMADAATAKANAAIDKARASSAGNHPSATILRGDFVAQPRLLEQEADAIIFSGSLNTLGEEQFYKTLGIAWKNARRELAFNFLCSPRLASGKHLTWYNISDVLTFANLLSSDVVMDDRYLEGDCMIAIRKN